MINPRLEALWGRALWGAALIFCLLPTLWFPLNRDQATFALGGQTVANGGALYRDFWDLKPPAIYWVYALPARFFPENIAAGVAALSAVALLLSAILLARLSQKLGRSAAGLGAGVWLVVLALEPGFSNQGQAETFANVAFLAAAMWAVSPRLQTPIDAEREVGTDAKLSIGKNSIFAACGAGFLAGVALCFKPTCILPLLPLLFWRKRIFREWLGWIIGVFAAPLMALFVLSARGELGAYIEIQKLFVAPYVVRFQPSFTDHALGLVAHSAFWARTLWLAAIFVTLALMERGKIARRAHFFAVLSFGGGFLALWVQNRSFAYQWTPMLPAFAFLAASGSVALGEKLGFSARKCAVWAALLPILWGGARSFPVWRDLSVWALSYTSSGDTPRDIAHARWLARFNTLDEAKTPSALPAAFATARFVKNRSKSGDGLFVWAYEPEIYLETGLTPPHRFYLHPPLIVAFSPDKWRAQAWRGLRNSPPKFIVLATGDDNRWFGTPPGDSKSLWRKTAIYPWFARNYRFAARFGRFETYQLKAQITGLDTAFARR